MGEYVVLQSFIFVALLGILAFHVGVYPPIALSVAVFTATSFYLLKKYRAHETGLLVLWFFITYALPFVHLVPYLWFDFDAEAPRVMWGMPVNPYMVDKSVVELMAVIGALGAVGFVIGQRLGGTQRGKHGWDDAGVKRPVAGRSLTIPLFCVLVGVSVLLSWLYAPRATIFQARYTEGVAISQDWNFGSIWMVSYIVLVWCLADAVLDADRRRARLKKAIVVATLLVIVGWLQLLRGDREAIPLAMASIFMMGRWQSRIARGSVVRVRVWTRKSVVLGGALIVVLSYLVGALRSSLAGMDWKSAAEVVADLWAEGALGFDNLVHGTWSAVLLTPLSIAGDYLAGSLGLKLGRDYLNYVLSLPPGFLADWLGYQRPIDAWHGPAWEMTYGIGGTHAVVVPFMNFRAIGVVLVLALWGYIVALCEKRASSGRSVGNAALWGTLVMVAPHWFWYGDKYFINAMIIWYGAALLYRFAVEWRREVTLRLRTVDPAGSCALRDGG
jgi:hypothetical protein